MCHSYCLNLYLDLFSTDIVEKKIFYYTRMSVHPISVSFSLRDDIWPNYLKKGKQSESMETMEKSLASNDYFHYFIFEIQAGMNAPISHYH